MEYAVYETRWKTPQMTPAIEQGSALLILGISM